MSRYTPIIQPLGTVGEVLSKSLITSLSCAYLASSVIRLLGEWHFDLGLGKISWYTKLAFFCIAILYMIASGFLWLSVMRTSGQSGAQQEIEMAEKQTHSHPKQSKKTKIEQSEEDAQEETEESYEIDPPTPNYRQTTRFITTTSLFAMIIFFGTLAYKQFWAEHDTSNRDLLQLHLTWALDST
jgi:hypothetical protein